MLHMLKIMQNFKPLVCIFVASWSQSPCNHVISHVTRRDVITIWTYVTILNNDRATCSLQSYPWQTERKVGPATVINIKLYGGWNDHIVWSRRPCDCSSDGHRL